MKKSLVILTDRFGLNFSGGAIATCRVFEPIQHDFKEIIVVAKQIGQHHFTNLKHLRYRHLPAALKHIRNLRKKTDLIYYGDFYMAYYYILAGVPFYFTYHDNWPAQKKLNFTAYIRSFFYIPIYQWIFKRAAGLINVSQYTYNYNASWNHRNFLIRNGINAGISKAQYRPIVRGQLVKIIMLGNIDTRKFGLANELFEVIQAFERPIPIEIHIYGKPKDFKIAEKIKRYNFVKLMGFSSDINFSPYDVFLSVSKMENLSIAVCEALANHTPVLAFDVGGLGEVVKNKKNGFLIEKFNICKMAATLEKMVLEPTAFQFTKDDLREYNWEIAAKRYKEILIP
ncbi:glycosyltransferase family 4 protein [Fulvivirgaceae bacterium BMA12]|uniref:Glycosyltransferase family 4 protein n=1 Tax=Agaribacillus aureus TaxID=3051825 RepID=A0ABT8L2U4_9BACT|nr:glycosyltransferase family 4 protein [Fulvivirgaceae bacterium BMA12]